MTCTSYSSSSRRFVLAFDIGTTFSGAAYAFLDPGEIPQIDPVTKYLDNPNVGWKLMIGPTKPSAILKDQMSTNLPRGKTITDVFSDFMSYLFDSTKALFISSDQNGEHRWNSVPREIELVLTHFQWQQPGDKVLIVDAGGGTIDISSYAVLDNAPLQVGELFRPEWRRVRYSEGEGGSRRKSKFNTPEDIPAFAQKFDEGLKRVFSDDKGSQYIKFGSPRDNDPQHGVKCVVDCIRENFKEILSMNSFAFLISGFASSPWLTGQLNQRLSDLGLKFFKPDTNTREPSNPEHAKREHKSYIDIEGDKRIPDAFMNMLSKVWNQVVLIRLTLLTDTDTMAIQGTKVLESREIRTRMYVVREGPPAREALAQIIKYDGGRREPQWMVIERGIIFDSVARFPCLVLTIQKHHTRPNLGDQGKCAILGKLKAHIRWVDSRTQRRTRATIVYKDMSETTHAGPRVTGQPVISRHNFDF
ncbi:hypothetical protein BDM02DRAFT_3127282 [Thelephora ganbajun]|uniref:Uncharacterized protein n=1 Tax=Thelephora ganbajun TaxID=370292 RepID=A0ACB6ZNM2_THEGA|nr:hypothetical protein BDM02DRAFT_3127282 [Thelephora ganbajun]